MHGGVAFAGNRVSLAKWTNREITSKAEADKALDELTAAIRDGTFDPKIDASDNLSAVAGSRASAKAEVSRIFQDPTKQRFAGSEGPTKESATSH